MAAALHPDQRAAPARLPERYVLPPSPLAAPVFNAPLLDASPAPLLAPSHPLPDYFAAHHQHHPLPQQQQQQQPFDTSSQKLFTTPHPRSAPGPLHRFDAPTHHHHLQPHHHHHHHHFVSAVHHPTLDPYAAAAAAAAVAVQQPDQVLMTAETTPAAAPPHQTPSPFCPVEPPRQPFYDPASPSPPPIPSLAPHAPLVDLTVPAMLVTPFAVEPGKLPRASTAKPPASVSSQTRAALSQQLHHALPPLPPPPQAHHPTQQTPKPAQHALPFTDAFAPQMPPMDDTPSPHSQFLRASLNDPALLAPDPPPLIAQQYATQTTPSLSQLHLTSRQTQPAASQFAFPGQQQQVSTQAQPLQQVVFSMSDIHPQSPLVTFAQQQQQQPHPSQTIAVQGGLPEDPGTTPLSYVAVPHQQPSALLLSPLQGQVEHAAPFASALAPSPDMGIHPLVQPSVSAPNVMGVPDLLTGSQYSVPPDVFESFMALGRSCRDIGRYDLAASTFRACMAVNPDSSDARAAYNSAYYTQGFYEPSLDLGPVFPEDLFHEVGNSLRAIGRATEAEIAYRAALTISPRHAHAWNNLGNSMRGRGQIIDAMSCYTASLTAQPGFAAAHCNLAGLLRDQGKPQDAEAQYRAALMSDPNLAEAAAGLGTALRDMGRTDEAVSFYVRAVSLQPEAADHHANLANTYKDLNRIEESIVSYQAALALQPDLPDAFCNMVHSLSVICDWRNREHNFATLLSIIDRQLDTLLHHPATNPRLYNTLVGALSNSTPQPVDVNGGSRSDRDGASVSATTSREENSFDRRRRYVHHPSSPTVVRKAKMRGKFAKFHTSAPSVVAPVLTSGLPSVQPFHALIYPMRPEKFRALSAAYATRAESMVSGMPHVNQRWTLPKGPRARLKVGYVSSDYNNHPYSHLTQSIYGLHRGGTTVECFCYALTPSDQSNWRLRIEREVEHFRDISGMNAKQSAETIANDGIHVLVNCNGYTKGARTELFALRPAPVQVSFMGFPGTLGAHYIEYFITDVVTSPPELASRMHSEALLYHPHSYFVNDHRQTSIPGPNAYPSGPLTRAHYGLPENCFLFIMHNQLYKLSPDTFDVWARILKRVPGSKIWLLRFPPTGEQRIRDEAAARGLSHDRLIFTDVAGKDEHVARAGLGDLFLDTPTCNAHTTGTDVLWSGVPMITCPGSLFASRVAASLLTAAGVPELIASDMVEYEDLAVELATNRTKLASIRARIESSRYKNALFDTERWVRNVEALYWQAWRRFEAGKEPAHIFGKDVYDGSTMVSKAPAVESMYSTTDSRRSETPMYGRMYHSTVAT